MSEEKVGIYPKNRKGYGNRMKISVLVAAYNGEKYIAEQLSSILPQLGAEDELIISDDNPEGLTRAAIEPFSADSRVKYIHGPGCGVDRNKEFLLRQCTGDVAFLSDQDDVWLPDKVSRVMAAIQGGACCVLHNAYLTDESLNKTGQTLFELRNAKCGTLHNIFKNCYTGACMALTRQAFEAAMPFPGDIPMHDQWLGLVAERVGRVELIETPLLLWRRNDGSMTGGRTGLAEKIKWRISITKDIFTYSFKKNSRS